VGWGNYSLNFLIEVTHYLIVTYFKGQSGLHNRVLCATDPPPPDSPSRGVATEKGRKNFGTIFWEATGIISPLISPRPLEARAPREDSIEGGEREIVVPEGSCEESRLSWGSHRTLAVSWMKGIIKLYIIYSSLPKKVCHLWNYHLPLNLPLMSNIPWHNNPHRVVCQGGYVYIGRLADFSKLRLSSSFSIT
jgi:hypothetical protein